MDLAVGGNVALVEGEELAYRSRQGLGESAEALSPIGTRWWPAGMLGEGLPARWRFPPRCQYEIEAVCHLGSGAEVFWQATGAGEPSFKVL